MCAQNTLMIQKVVYANEIRFLAIFLLHPHREHCTYGRIKLHLFKIIGYD